MRIHVHPDHLAGSSLLREQMGEDFDGVPRDVPMQPLDRLVSERSLAGPFLLKVDVQGAELDVLSGAEALLRNTDMVLLEISLFQLMKDSPQLHDVIAWMSERGFYAWDIYDGHARPLDGALGQCDIAFVRDDGPFRADHGYADPDTWKEPGAA